MKAICDRCGFEFKHAELRKEWTGLMVCHGPATNGCWEPRNQQDYVRGVPDNQGVRPNMRPEPADVFIDPLAITLTASGPVASTAAGQTIQNLDIVADGTDGITVLHGNVTVKNCRISHKGANGVSAFGVANLTIQDLRVRHIATPDTGALASVENNLDLNSITGLRVSRVEVLGGSAGVYVQSSPDAVLTEIHGGDFRGPFPRGQLVQFNASPRSSLTGFSCVNDLDTSYTEDNVNVYQSDGCTIQTGLVDGNNAPNGAGVIFDESSNGRCSDVDATHQGNGAFTAYSGTVGKSASNNLFLNCRTRDGHNVGKGGRAAPSSNGLSFTSFAFAGTVVGTQFKYCVYHNPANAANLAYDTTGVGTGGAPMAVYSVSDVDFTAISPTTLHWDWEGSGSAPFVAILNGPDGSGNPTQLDTASANPTVVGKLFAESGDPDETFTYSIVSDTSGNLGIAGAVVSAAGTFTEGLFTATFRATGNTSGLSKDYVYEFSVADSIVNLLTDPSNISSSNWAKGRVTVSGSGPEQVKETVDAGTHEFSQTPTVSNAAGNYVTSIRCADLGGRWVRLFFCDTVFASIGSVDFDPATGTVGSTGGYGSISSSITGKYATNLGGGQWEFGFTATKPLGVTSVYVIVNTVLSDGGSNSFAGDITKGVQVYRMGLEAA